MLELNFESGLGDVVGAKILIYLIFKNTIVHKKRENVIFLMPCEAANAEPRFPTLAKVAREFLTI
eukprot:snap_masked-scaffold_4-processed-gene-9.18-mRNA-1 protein AED:1.00 eAED:1.00 QI:0/0/0/0/1/1/2/0/64